MRLRSVLIAAALTIAMLVCTGCAAEKEQMQTAGETKAADKAESETANVFGEFTAQTIDGEEVTQDIFTEADLAMVNVWGTFCGPCIREMPDLGELSREYADKGFKIVGLISDVDQSGDETALEIIESTQADYIHVVASEDLHNAFLKDIQVVPTTIFVDKNGNQVGEMQLGAKSKEEWSGIIDEMLKKAADEA